jgi:hypothetical protein
MICRRGKRRLEQRLKGLPFIARSGRCGEGKNRVKLSRNQNEIAGQDIMENNNADSRFL